MGAIRGTAVTVQDQAMIDQVETQPGGDGVLALFDHLIAELLDPATL